MHFKSLHFHSFNHKVRRYRGAGGIRLRLFEQMGLKVSFEGVHSNNNNNK